ncbi:hypothetical protein TcasGA2_TC002384 [Tribolium castaneum]|uniref:Uncharacterized protein n=1 Tax=Tribolium castaneum TaxID=7070 RepID=D7EKY1_TRICA|nr:PREDICTED: uncharacterized protein LOC103315183 [Tribolium castaneum]EFA11735.1 hypothetical protein TcasGA2_TC002384 [Tribolium castaneum]|eukprot:XP_008201446.1 PREDICTED: uncharacterized protein LOC103315183 [Tribolium castaneum]
MNVKLLFGFVVVIFCFVNSCSANLDEKSLNNATEYEVIGRQLVEQGRTLVHHAAKRFMIILPAIFFKLGIAFTLLILVALAAVNNGFIGFMLLVVGLSSVLARLQDTRRAAAVPVSYISPLPPYHHHEVWDRSDVTGNRNDETKASYYNSYSGQGVQYNPAGASYYAKYANAKV